MSSLLGVLLLVLIVSTTHFISTESHFRPQKISSIVQSNIKSFMEQSLLVTSLSLVSMSKPALASSPINNPWYNPYNQRIFDTQRGSFLPSHAELYLGNEIGTRNVVVIGEIHSNPCHHRVEFEIVKTLASLPSSDSKDNIKRVSSSSVVPNSNIAIGMEAFYRQHQPALDDFIFSHKNFELLKKQTDWQTTWGYDLNYYSKILRYASKNNIRILGLNCPQPVVHYVSQVGLQNLPEELKNLLPSVDISDKLHRQQFDSEMVAAGLPSHALKGASLQRMYEAQCLWDDYMAESASMYLGSEQAAKRLVIIAGSGHVLGRSGIPNRILKRLPAGSSSPFVVVPQQVDWLPTGLPDIELPLSRSDCDWAWYTEKEIV